MASGTKFGGGLIRKNTSVRNSLASAGASAIHRSVRIVEGEVINKAGVKETPQNLKRKSTVRGNGKKRRTTLNSSESDAEMLENNKGRVAIEIKNEKGEDDNEELSEIDEDNYEANDIRKNWKRVEK